MGSEQQPTSTLTATPAHAEPSSVSTALSTTPISIASPSSVLKQAGSDLEPSPEGPRSTSSSHVGLNTASSSVSPKAFGALSPRFSSRSLTGAAAMTGEKRTREARDATTDGRGQSVNPAVHAIGALLGQKQGISRPQDAPKSTTAMSEGAAAVAPSSAPDPKALDRGTSHPSPMSTSSSIPQGDEPREPRESQGSVVPTESAVSPDGQANRAFTFPGPLLGEVGGGSSREPARGMSLPVPVPVPESNQQHHPGSTSTPRKHKCPYCATDFTRHHNLKSHLLTHSQEKPFVCSTCQARFRRLHDLKRHTKLHTGERPHICPRCGRRFARGDALARHNKGQGGCAGRRPSMGSFNGEDDPMSAEVGADDSMEGLVYSEESHEDERMDEDEPPANSSRRLSLPGGPASNPSLGETVPQGQPAGAPGSFLHHRHRSTYPPPGPSTPRFPRPSAGNEMTLDQVPSPRFPTGSSSGMGSTSMLLQGSMTESPKPLSPGSALPPPNRRTDSNGSRHHRSPSLVQQLQQQQLSRRNSARSPPHVGLPPPLASGGSRAPQLPSLPGLGSTDSKYSGSSQSSATHQNAQAVEPMSSLLRQQMSSGPTMSRALSKSTGGLTEANLVGNGISAHDHGIGDGSRNHVPPTMDIIWNYVRSLEARVEHLSEEIVSLKRELVTQARQGETPRSTS